MYRLVEKIAIVALPLIACVPFGVVPYPPMLDFYTHIEAAHVIAFFQDPAFRYSEHYTLRLAQPMALVQLIIAGLERLMDPIVAGRVYLVGFTLALYWSTWFYLRSIGREHAALHALAALPLAHSGLVYLGFLPFIACWPLFSLLLGVWGARQSTLRRGALASALIVVLFCCHPVGAAIAILALGCLMVGSIVVPPRRVPRLADVLPLGTSAAVFIPYLLIWGRFSGAGEPLSFAGPVQTVKAFLAYNLAASESFSLYIKLGALLAFTVVLLKSWRAWRPDLALTTIALLMLGLLIPVNVGSLWPAGPRFFPFALLVALGLVGLGLKGRRLFLVGVSLVVTLDVASLTRKGLELEPRYRAALSALNSIQPGSKILPILVDPHEGTPNYGFYETFFCTYNLYRGGANPYIHAIPFVRTGSVVHFKRYNEFGYRYLFQPSRNLEPTAYDGVSQVYDYVLLWGNAPALEAALAREMITVPARLPLHAFQSRRLRR
jgi:hypothetical protein